jgi:hypothetical protein
MIRIINLVVLAVTIAWYMSRPAEAEDTGTAGDWSREEFLGFAVPRPEPYDSIFITLDSSVARRDTSLAVTLYLSDNGKVKRIDFIETDRDRFKDLEKRLRKIRFAYSRGREMNGEVALPLNLHLLWSLKGSHFARIDFPFDQDGSTDSSLVKKFFSANEIELPDVAMLPEIFYRPLISDSNQAYPVVFAAVRVSPAGELEDVGFPIPEFAKNTHQVQTSLMHARFKPAIIDGKPRSATLFLTFRFFDVLSYPYSPTAIPDSNAAESPLAARYFLQRGFSLFHLECPAVLRFPSDGLIPFEGVQGRKGGADIILTIDSLGRVQLVSLRSVSSGFRAGVQQLLRRTKWYPAMDRSGRFVPFTGRVRARLTAPIYVVISPEWMGK